MTPPVGGSGRGARRSTQIPLVRVHRPDEPVVDNERNDRYARPVADRGHVKSRYLARGSSDSVSPDQDVEPDTRTESRTLRRGRFRTSHSGVLDRVRSGPASDRRSRCPYPGARRRIVSLSMRRYLRTDRHLRLPTPVREGRVRVRQPTTRPDGLLLVEVFGLPVPGQR